MIFGDGLQGAPQLSIPWTSTRKGQNRMGLLDKLKALGDPRHGIESTIATQRRVLESVRLQLPDRDLNAWLALTLAGRPGFGGNPSIRYFERTVVFSVASIEIAARGLGLHVALKEATDARISPHILSPYDTEFGNILRSALQLPVGTLLNRWATMNPWTAENYPDVEFHLIELQKQWSSR